MFSPIKHTHRNWSVILVLIGSLNMAMADIEANKAAYTRINQEAWSQGQLAAVDEFVAPEYVYHEPAMGDFPGPEGLKQVIAIFRTAYPNLNFTINDMIAEGNQVVMRWSAAGTHQGGLLGIPPTGLNTTTVGINIVCFNAAGMMVEEWSHWDVSGLMQQLGVVQPPRPGPEYYLWDTPSEIAGNPGDLAENKLLVLRVKQQFWNGKDIAGLDETHHPNALGHDLSFPGAPSYEAYKTACLMYVIAFPDFRVSIDGLVAEGDMVVSRWTATGTHQGELIGIPASGKAVQFKGITIYRLANGKVAETWWAYDAFGLIQQITSPPQSAAEGTWIITVPTPEGNLTMVHVISPLDQTGSQYSGILWQVNANPTLFGMFPEVEQGGQFWATQTVRTGANTFETGMITYGTKTGESPVDPTETISIGTATWTITGPNSNEGQTMLSIYLPEQDVDGDGIPDKDRTPAACTPFSFTSKRLEIMTPCIPTPLPGQ